MSENGQIKHRFDVLGAIRKRMALRFAAILTLILAATGAMIIMVNHVAQDQMALENFEQRATSTLILISPDVSDAVLRNDKPAMTNLVRRVLSVPGVNIVQVTDTRGTSLVRAGRANAELKPGIVRSALASGGLTMQRSAGLLSVTMPLQDKSGRMIGTLSLATPTDNFVDQGLQRLSRNALLLLALCAVGALFAFFVARDMTEPLRQLIDFAQQANLKRLSARLDIRTGDELETLAGTFNRMMQRLDSSMKRIQRLAFVDTVTELPNRERFRQETEEAIKGTVADKNNGAVLTLDLDRFNRVNDTLGQAQADELLALAAGRIAAAIRAADRIVRLQSCAAKPALLARVGASEFGILIPDVAQPVDAGRFAQLVAASMRQPFEMGGHRLTLGASIGIAVFPNDGNSVDTVTKAADMALTHARNAGGGRAIFFTKAMNQRAMERLRLEAELRAAIEQGHIVAYFQPKISLATGRIHGCEALVRWLHPQRGMISPGVFIDAAEESGLISALGEVVLRDACRKGVGWLRRGIALRVAVNVSPTQFADEKFSDMVLSVLAETGFPAGLLELEVTESTAMADPERVKRMIEPLRAKKVRFAIDDFGTGHSSLSTLSQLPFDVFKIDQSFVRGLETDKHAPVLIETILAMASSLNYETVAEGVETPAQAAFLKARGCTLAQGYLFGAPMPADQFEERARAWAEKAQATDRAAS